MRVQIYPLYTLVALCIAAAIGRALDYWFRIGFWLGFILTLVAMLINGWIATIEDDQPGGFNNPQ